MAGTGPGSPTCVGRCGTLRVGATTCLRSGGRDSHPPAHGESRAGGLGEHTLQGHLSGLLRRHGSEARVPSSSEDSPASSPSPWGRCSPHPARACVLLEPLAETGTLQPDPRTPGSGLCAGCRDRWRRAPPPDPDQPPRSGQAREKGTPEACLLSRWAARVPLPQAALSLPLQPGPGGQWDRQPLFR